MRLNFFGDLSLYNIDYTKFQYGEKLTELINSAEYNIVNLESVITNSLDKLENQVANLSASEKSEVLLEPFNIVSLANNHIQDYKNKGIYDTLDILNKNSIMYFGIGNSQKEALKPLLIEENGYKIALFGATRYANAMGDKKLGTAHDKISILVKQIKKLKRNGYFIISYFHWGYEYVRIPSPRERKIARRCIDAGADLIIGSHSHIYQCIEEYKGKLIAYSLGNFVFHSSVYNTLSPVKNDIRLKESFLVSIKINKNNSYTYKLHSYQLNNNGVELCNPTKNLEIISELNNVSKILSASKCKYLKAYYKQTYDISQQNIKVRKDFQEIKKKSLKDKFHIYSKANLQDIKNRLVGLIISLTK